MDNLALINNNDGKKDRGKQGARILGEKTTFT